MHDLSKFSRLLHEYTAVGEFTLRAPLFYYHNTGVIIVPSGFVTNLDSVPRIPLVYAAFKGRAVKAAAVHDYLYGEQLGKEFADRIFLDAMGHEGLPARVKYPIYWGVKLFGASSYSKYSEKKS